MTELDQLKQIVMRQSAELDNAYKTLGRYAAENNALSSRVQALSGELAQCQQQNPGDQDPPVNDQDQPDADPVVNDQDQSDYDEMQTDQGRKLAEHSEKSRRTMEAAREGVKRNGGVPRMSGDQANGR